MPETNRERFSEERERLMKLMQSYAGRDMLRFLTLDNQVYKEGALSASQKELLGLVSSIVLRCDDCINYHLVQCKDAGVSTDELIETLSIGLVVGGSITIPHIRRAIALWDEIAD